MRNGGNELCTTRRGLEPPLVTVCLYIERHLECLPQGVVPVPVMLARFQQLPSNHLLCPPCWLFCVRIALRPYRAYLRQGVAILTALALDASLSACHRTRCLLAAIRFFVRCRRL